MSFKLNLDLEFFWSITERGEPHVELAPKNRPENVKAAFTFDKETLLRGLYADLDELPSDPDFDMDEWSDLVVWMRDTADTIEDAMRNASA